MSFTSIPIKISLKLFSN